MARYSSIDRTQIVMLLGHVYLAGMIKIYVLKKSNVLINVSVYKRSTQYCCCCWKMFGQIWLYSNFHATPSNITEPTMLSDVRNGLNAP
jgi:hypothetical protein